MLRRFTVVAFTVWALQAVARWLFFNCGMVWLMVALGGITRLTGSGLSMVPLSLCLCCNAVIFT
jgi:heme A synthase